MLSIEKYDSDNLIYNRFDLLFPDTYEEVYVSDEKHMYPIQYMTDGEKAIINVWGKELPSGVFEEAVNNIFTSNATIEQIEVQSSINNYNEQLVKHGDVKIQLPNDAEDLMARLGKKGRYNLKRERRKLRELFEDIKVIYESEDISQNTVKEFFDWKKVTHGTDYHMTPKQYIQKYHVTNAVRINGDGKDIAVLFFCRCEETVYLENFSYDSEYKDYSPGFLIYTFFLEKMVNDCCKTVFLGKSGLAYKKRFGSIETECFSGTIYRAEVFCKVNEFLKHNNIKNIALYGLGKCGLEYLQIIKKLNVELIFGIDKKVRDIEGIEICVPEKIKEMPDVDCIVVCLENRNKEVEELLQQFCCRYIYYDRLMKLCM